MKTISSSFEYCGRQIGVEWFDIDNGALPPLQWQQVYAVGNLEGQCPVVEYADGHRQLTGE